MAEILAAKLRANAHLLRELVNLAAVNAHGEVDESELRMPSAMRVR